MGDEASPVCSYHGARHVFGGGAIVEVIHYLSALGPFQYIGVAGFFVYIAAFASVQFGWLDGNSAAYALCNVVAATLVAISLFEEFNLSSALIQGSWIVIGLVGLARHVFRRAPKTPNPFSVQTSRETI